MSKKIILVLAGVFLFFGGNNIARANIIINEVKLYPAEERFIELYNQDSSEIDLTNWYIQRKTQTGSTFGSLVSKTNFENKKINANGFFVISRNPTEKSDIVLSTLTLTESNIIQIKNSAGEIVNIACWGEINDCTEPKAINPIEGQSIQKDQDGVWFSGVSTLGVQNYTSINNLEDNNSSNVSSNISSESLNQTTTESKTKIIEIPKIKTKIIAKSFAFVGVPVELKLEAIGYSNEPLYYGRYFLNFGDGDSKEIKTNDTEKLIHTFFYEGEYVVSLEYYQNYYSSIPDASDKIIIKVVPATILISNVGDEKDFFVEISNNTNYEADISKWILASSTKSFVFAKNTILPAKKKIIISSRVTGFSISDKETLKLMNSQWETIFEYSSFIKPTKTLTRNSFSQISKNIESNNLESRIELLSDDSISETKEQILTDNMSANAIKSGAGSNFLYGFGLLIFLGISASAVYFIRNNSRKLTTETAGGDFEILDE